MGHAARMGDIRKAYKILVGKPYGNRPFGGSRSGRKGNIKIDRKKHDMRMWIEYQKRRRVS